MHFNALAPTRPSRHHRLPPAFLPALALSVAMVAAVACTPPEGEVQPADAGAFQADHFVPSRPETVSWGWYPLDKAPVLTIQSGQTVRIDTLTHAGSTQAEEPVDYLSAMGVPREEILRDTLDFWASREDRPREGRSGHVITGPIYIDGAELGDTLEVQILDIGCVSSARLWIP